MTKLEKLKQFIYDTLYLDDFSFSINKDILDILDADRFDWTMIFYREDIDSKFILKHLEKERKLYKKGIVHTRKILAGFYSANRAKDILIRSISLDTNSSVNPDYKYELTPIRKLRKIIRLILPEEYCPKFSICKIAGNRNIYYKIYVKIYKNSNTEYVKNVLKYIFNDNITIYELP